MRRRISIWQFFLYFFASVSVIFEFFFGVIPGVWFLVQIILLAGVSTVITYYIFKKKEQTFSEKLSHNILILLSVFGFLLSITLSCIWYYEFFPGKISDIEIVRDKQHIVFVQMSHIATDRFFQNKKQTLNSLSASGYTFLAEWVAPGSDESHSRFNKSLGFEFNASLYPLLAHLGGLTVQDQDAIFAGIPEKQMRNVDMSMDEIANLLWTGSREDSRPIADIDRDLGSLLELSPQEKLYIGYLFRTLLNWSSIHTTSIETVIQPDQQELFDVILNQRNTRITDYIVAHPDENIVIVYGALHFSGVLENLVAHNPKWKIQHIKSDTPYND